MRRRNMLSENNEDVIYNINIIDYLTIEALEDGLTASLSVNACEYCFNGDGNWKTLAAGTATESINTGQTLSFRGNLIPATSNGIGTFTVNKNFNLKGNCMSMLFGDAGKDNYSLSGKNYAFRNLFDHCTTLKSISDNFLPATTLASSCYYYMFGSCTGLTTAPELPATALANYCYSDMFVGCSSLTTAPEQLPATTLVHACYSGMFRNCTNLTTAPALPATTLANYCYSDMFYNCRSLSTAPTLPATTLADACYSDMFYGCIFLSTAPTLPATTLAGLCYQSMFRNCTNLTTAPALPATTLAVACYQHMFYGCIFLTTAPTLPATTLADACYQSMFEGCSSLNYVNAQFLTTPESSYTDCWLYGVSSTGTFVKNPDATWDVRGVHGIPEGWAVVNDGEESGGNLITFTVDGIEYQAEEGMTWGEWVDSEYNVNKKFLIDLDNSIGYDGFVNWVGTEEDYVYADDIIQENYNYWLVS